MSVQVLSGHFIKFILSLQCLSHLSTPISQAFRRGKAPFSLNQPFHHSILSALAESLGNRGRGGREFSPKGEKKLKFLFNICPLSSYHHLVVFFCIGFYTLVYSSL